MAQEGIQGGVRLLSLKERRLRYRQETVDAILAAARSVMQEQGVAALNLNEVARRLGISGQALAKYFPNKMALYETLFRMGVRMFREQDAEIWHTTEPGWERIQAWFEARLALAQQHPDLYRLALDLPTVPGFIPSEEARQETQQLVAAGTQAIKEVIEAGVMVPPMPPDQVFDLLLAIRRGIIAEHLGKQPVLQPGEEERFRHLIPQALALLKAAWSPQPPELMRRLAG
ncbi:MAG TPA: TetR/AcrR family transcriptional regulator [Ktedonobacteraceae bacterium]|nr:TetR/AcrR family transcriptional regulator [Ktedonobacteraceae bacterium]